MTVAEEQISSATFDQTISTYSDERARLGIRLQAHEPDQTPGTLNTSTNELAGRAIDAAMSHGVIVAPLGAPIVIGLQGQVGPGNARQLVLYNLTAWVKNGRKLGANDMETFAVLEDSKISGPGDTFVVEGVRYMAKLDNGALTFHRN